MLYNHAISYMLLQWTTHLSCPYLWTQKLCKEILEGWQQLEEVKDGEKMPRKESVVMKYMQKFGDGFCILFYFIVLGTYLDNIFKLQMYIEMQVC